MKNKIIKRYLTTAMMAEWTCVSRNTYMRAHLACLAGVNDPTADYAKEFFELFRQKIENLPKNTIGPEPS